MIVAASITLRNIWLVPIEGYLHGAMGLTIIFMLMSPLLRLFTTAPKQKPPAPKPLQPEFEPED